MRQLCIVWLLFQYAHRNPISGADVGTIQCAKHFNDTDVAFSVKSGVLIQVRNTHVGLEVRLGNMMIPISC